MQNVLQRYRVLYDTSYFTLLLLQQNTFDHYIVACCALCSLQYIMSLSNKPGKMFLVVFSLDQHFLRPPGETAAWLLNVLQFGIYKGGQAFDQYAPWISKS